MMKKYSLLLILGLCIAFFSNAQNNNIFINAEDNPELKVTIKAYFGIQLLTQHTGFVRYAYIQIKSTGEQKITYLTQQQFIEQVSGVMVSKANPDKINYLEKYQVMAHSFEELWKLRYTEFPYAGARSQEKGWAANDFAPSEAQWNFLKREYGYSNFEQLLYGENMWKLLQDSQKPAWQSQYTSLK